MTLKILMVCMGNICRSPLAEGIFRESFTQKQIPSLIDSAGTLSYHSGENPDPRAVAVAKKYGIDISKLLARQFQIKDFDNFDKIFVMDSMNYSDINSLSRNETDKSKIHLLLNISHPNSDKSVPDPYYGGTEKFEEVYFLLQEASEIISTSIIKNDYRFYF